MGEIQTALRRIRTLSEEEFDTICRAHSVRVLTLFGSAVDPATDDPGDLDIGVMFEPGDPHDILGLLEDLVSVLGTERVDLLDAERATETARVRAIADGEGLYESEPMAYAEAAMAADALFMETAEMRRAALASLNP
ncbi:MAG: hypothetical protein GEU79_17155 [Acidimicrobiia bacterium]|nr:hypothetical protein [Acidimicrobiia bacterium]